MNASPETIRDEALVNIEIDGKPLRARRGDMVIQAADDAGIEIPRFCYHSKLSIAANCRMCLVQVEKVPKPLPACATPVTEGMKVYTKSPMAVEAQQGTMEFLLINHPLDCPICDQGGECDLQEMSIGYGKSTSSYHETKRVVKDKDIGPLISTEMTRCIHCTRCVRFGDEIAGIRELGATGRGENMSIGTYIEKAIASEMSGNVIELCPVGALTSKPFRFTARAWEMDQNEAISPHDCVGTNITVQVRRNTVMRVDPRENEAINEVWISDRDRYSYEALNSEERLRSPMIKRDGQWQETDWNTAFEFVRDGLKTVINNHGSGELGTLISPSCTVEEMYLTQKLVRGLGSANIDHRLRQLDFSDQENAPVYPWLGQSIEDLEQLDAALLIGSNVRKDQPLVAHRLRKAAQRGARMMLVNTIDYEFTFPVREKLISSPAAIEKNLAGICKAAFSLTGAAAPDAIARLLENVAVNESHQAIAQELKDGTNSTVILGELAAMHPAFSTLRCFASLIAEQTGSALGYLTAGANSAGACLAGVLPHRDVAGKDIAGAGLNAMTMFSSQLKAYLLINMEPGFDCADSATALDALRNSDFVVSLTPFRGETKESYADVMLPIAPYSETSGTYVNAAGCWQSFTGSVAAAGESRPGWKVLRVLGNFFNLDGFDYVASDEIRNELAGIVAGVEPSNSAALYVPEKLSQDSDGVVRIADVPIYAADNIVRRAHSLQMTEDARKMTAITISHATAERLDLVDDAQVAVKQKDSLDIMPLAIDDSVPDGCVLLPAALPLACSMGANGATIELEKLKGQ